MAVQEITVLNQYREIATEYLTYADVIHDMSNDL